MSKNWDTLPTDYIKVMSSFLSPEEAHSYLQTSKNGYNDIKDSMPIRKNEHIENMIISIVKDISFTTTAGEEFQKLKPYMDYIEEHYTEWKNREYLSIVSESYKEHFIRNKIYFTRMNKNSSFVTYIIMALCH